MKTFLIMLGVEIFLKWLSKEGQSENALIKDILQATEIEHLEGIAQKQSTKEILSEIVDFAAGERLGDVFGKLIGRLLK